MSQSSFSFSLSNPIRYGPRLGSITLKRNSEHVPNVTIATPGLLAGTSRGAVPHLSRDHVRMTDALRWVNVPFETFLEQTPPVPILYAQQVATSSNPHPLHSFLGFDESKHILSMSARDPNDTRDMPPNGNAAVSVHSLRGVLKLSPTEWTSYVRLCQPDVVFALSDTPFTDPPYSQKRLTKSIERSAAWLAALLRPGPVHIPPRPTNKAKPPAPAPPLPESSNSNAAEAVSHPTPPIFVPLAGLTSVGARRAFAASLLEPLCGPDAAALAPLRTLDDGVAGYVLDLAPLKLSFAALAHKAGAAPALAAPVQTSDADAESVTALLRASLAAPPPSKPRLVTGAGSPHEVLRLVRDVGVDLFDAAWAQKAADVGVALDFAFPAPPGGRREIGHNLYDGRYRLDFGCLADGLPAPLPGLSHSADTDTDRTPGARTCPCAACAPRPPPARIYHGHDAPHISGEAERPGSGSDAEGMGDAAPLPPYTRAYIHHLLHTHEMSAHALLAMHNLAVLDAFLAGVRGVLAADAGAAADAQGNGVDAGEGNASRFAAEVRAFGEAYDARLGVLEEAGARWREVDLARGKGRLARERKKEGEGELELE